MIQRHQELDRSPHGPYVHAKIGGSLAEMPALPFRI